MSDSAKRTRTEIEKTTEPAPLEVDDPQLYVNRELGLLAFQWRVLEEARDPSNPLLERVKFLSILFSNLDEFFMVRVAGIMQKLETGQPEVNIDGRPIAIGCLVEPRIGR